MNRERAKELLPIIQAYAEGKDVEYRIDKNDNWKLIDTPVWTDRCEYRIKPEPIKGIVYVATWFTKDRRFEWQTSFDRKFLESYYSHNSNFQIDTIERVIEEE